MTRRRVGEPVGSTTARGYGQQHQVARKLALADFRPGVTRCARGGEIMHDADLPELDHTDDRTGYLGLSCRRHNRGARDRFAAMAELTIWNDEYWITPLGDKVHRDPAMTCCSPEAPHRLLPW